MTNPTLVQTVYGVGTGLATTRTAPITGFTPGNSILVKAGSGSQNAPSNVFDSTGTNVYTFVDSVYAHGSQGSSNRWCGIYLCKNPAPMTSISIDAASAIGLLLVAEEIADVGGVRDSNGTYNDLNALCNLTASGGAAGDFMSAAMAWTGGTTPRATVNPNYGDTWVDETQVDVGSVHMASAYATAGAGGTRGPKFQNPAVSFGIVSVALYGTLPPVHTWAHTVSIG